MVEQLTRDTDDLLERGRRFVLHPWATQGTWGPTTFVGGEGCYLVDSEGRRYLDFSSQLVNVKAFLDRNGVDTGFFDFGSLNAASPDASAPAAAATPHSLPSASTIASSGGAIFSQSLKLILGTASAV